MVEPICYFNARDGKCLGWGLNLKPNSTKIQTNAPKQIRVDLTDIVFNFCNATQRIQQEKTIAQTILRTQIHNHHIWI